MIEPSEPAWSAPRFGAVAALLLGALGVVGVGSVGGGCEPAQHPRQMTKKAVDNLCHVAFDCCTAVERGLVNAALPYGSRQACHDELDDALGGALAAAVEAVDRGTAVFDADAAAGCTKEGQAAIDSCAGGDAFVDGTGQLSVLRAGFGLDPDDSECLALAARGFTRGVVDDGDECVSAFECADFGDCVIDDDNGAAITRDGACRAHADRSGDCTTRPCQPGLVCVSGVCDEPPPLADDGDACLRDSDCASALCASVDGDDPVCVRPDIDDGICDGRALLGP
ncbi:MAG: hypothetical protein FJ137_13945 [Deltaproteobacteria bacterium]|nr:hypothetical protein [Deltaproteobacteria bacterium]